MRVEQQSVKGCPPMRTAATIGVTRGRELQHAAFYNVYGVVQCNTSPQHRWIRLLFLRLQTGQVLLQQHCGAGTICDTGVVQTPVNHATEVGMQYIACHVRVVTG